MRADVCACLFVCMSACSFVHVSVCPSGLLCSSIYDRVRLCMVASVVCVKYVCVVVRVGGLCVRVSAYYS